jgi:Cof subfamily protein (haloacid dehalogenase superfamily)
VADLIALDLDGTLLTTGKQVTPRTKRVLDALMNQGIKIVLATARPPRSVARFYKALDLNTCVICYNGALVYDPPSRTVLAHHPIPMKTAQDIILYSRELCPEILTSAEVLDHWFTDRVSNEYQTETAKEFKPDTLGPIESWLKMDVTKILLQGPQVYLTKIRSQLQTRHNKSLSMAQSENNLLQIMAGGVSKGSALKFVCEHYNIPIDRTIAVGDAQNDLDMLNLAGMAIAMPHSPEKVKEAADYITVSNDEDGVAEALEKFLL